jgi:hypothetical protein
MPLRSGKMGRMRVKEASPAKVSRPGAKKRPARDRAVISLKGPGGLPRKAKRPARGGLEQAVTTARETPADPPSIAPPGARDLKTSRLERIKERAGAKRPAVPRGTVAAATARPERKRKPTSEETPRAGSTAVMEAPAVVMEAPPVIEAPAVMMEAPPVIEAPAVVMEAPPAAPMEAAASVDTGPAPVADVQSITPAVTALAAPVDRDLSATAHRRAWSPPKASRRTSTPVTLAVRLISKLLRWGGVLRR